MRALALGELGHVTLFENDLSQAESLALESLAICKETENRQGMAEPETVLGSIALRLGDLERAQEHFQNALAIAVESWTWAQALHTLLAWSHLLVATGKDEQALEVVSLVQHQRASWQWSRDQAAALGSELQARLPSEVATRASARGTEITLQDLARELLREAV
jgi:tetratricopeptide (TPR) repeat protein